MCVQKCSGRSFSYVLSQEAESEPSRSLVSLGQTRRSEQPARPLELPDCKPKTRSKTKGIGGVVYSWALTNSILSIAASRLSLWLCHQSSIHSHHRFRSYLQIHQRSLLRLSTGLYCVLISLGDRCILHVDLKGLLGIECFPPCCSGSGISVATDD
ncbi:hypothetical protein PROFUN_04237 [Planoprotostelium fungivorum]|uniref:Uncharacterized protein n=1 Tax=Planoprotostelium fungivorum TaxID=1890364 RepID=A0A2P6NW37_9EUKA|nr:hypothetical protein PROFUN_04237 [Planoprotostelium fungivorum]